MAATLESVRKAVGKKGHSPAFAWLADLERQSGNLDAALMRVADGLAFFPDNLAGLIVQSAIFFEKEQWENAGESCKDVLRKDPFCLSALRRLGDVNGKLGNIAERNFYYQRVHDLDPLDPFWSDAFNETVIEPATPGETSVALSENEASEESIPQEMPELAPLEEAAPKLSLPPDLSKNEDDPFSSLSILLPAENENNSEISFDSLENSLNDALSGFGTEPTEKEYFPADDISGGEITSAFSGIFGPTEANSDSEPASSSMFHIPTSLESEETIELAPVEAVSAQEEDEPQSLSSAFDDIFGEDELPEEFVPLKPVTPAVDESLNSDPSSAFEKSFVHEEASGLGTLVPEEPPTNSDVPPVIEPESEILNIDDSSETLASLLAPLEKTVEEPIEEPVGAPTSTNFTEDVSSSLDALFGDSDDLEMPMAPLMPKEEIPLEVNSLETEMKDAEDTLELPPKVVAESPLSAAVDSSFSALFGDDDDELLSPPLKAGASESESPSVDTLFGTDEKRTPSAEKTEMDEAISGAFDHLFNTNDDDLVDEKTLETENNVDGLMSSDETPVSAEKKNVNLDERLNTRTLAEIYFEQGLFDEALNIYKDLAKKEPNNAEIAERLTVIEQKRSEKLDKV
jgi:tetratricopeptide (TPR) repeat protein